MSLQVVLHGAYFDRPVPIAHAQIRCIMITSAQERTLANADVIPENDWLKIK